MIGGVGVGWFVDLGRQRNFVHEVADVALETDGVRSEGEAIERGEVGAKGIEEGPVREETHGFGHVDDAGWKERGNRSCRCRTSPQSGKISHDSHLCWTRVPPLQRRQITSIYGLCIHRLRWNVDALVSVAAFHVPPETGLTGIPKRKLDRREPQAPEPAQSKQECDLKLAGELHGRQKIMETQTKKKHQHQFQKSEDRHHRDDHHFQVSNRK